jgi:hypothetical protein
MVRHVETQGRMLAPLKDDRPTNKYGELVRFHDPVCILCSQRVGIGTDYLTSKANEIVCQHCWKPE